MSNYIVIDPQLSPVDPISHSLYLLSNIIDPPDIFHIRRRQTPQGERCFMGYTDCLGEEIGPFTIRQMRGLICGRVTGILRLSDTDTDLHPSVFAGAPT